MIRSTEVFTDYRHLIAALWGFVVDERCVRFRLATFGIRTGAEVDDYLRNDFGRLLEFLSSRDTHAQILVETYPHSGIPEKDASTWERYRRNVEAFPGVEFRFIQNVHSKMAILDGLDLEGGNHPRGILVGSHNATGSLWPDLSVFVVETLPRDRDLDIGERVDDAFSALWDNAQPIEALEIVRSGVITIEEEGGEECPF